MKIIFFTLFLVISYLGFSQATFTSFRAGNWRDTASATTPWILIGSDADKIPDSNDDVIIDGNTTVTITSNVVCKSLFIKNGSTLNTNNRIVSFVGGNLFRNEGIINGNFNCDFMNQTLDFYSSTSLTSGYFVLVKSVVLNLNAGTSLTFIGSSSALNVNNNSTINNSGSISASNFSTGNTSGNIFNNLSGSDLTINNNLSIQNPITFNSSSNSQVNFGSGVTTIPNWSYHNLNLTGNSNKSLSTNLTTNGNLTVTSGTLTLGSNNLTVSGNLTNSGTISQSSGTVSVAGTTTCSGTSAITVGILNQTGNFTVSSGTLNLGSTTANLSGFLSNSGTISSTGTLNIAGALTFNGSGNLASDNTSTIVMNGSSNQTITNSTSSNIPFYNLTTSNSGQISLSVTSTGRFTLKNILTVSSGTFSAGSDILTLLSDASSTAVIGNSPGTISGTIIMQRFIPSYSGLSSGYKFLASPASSVSITDWDEELLMSIGRANDGSTPAYLGGDGNASGSPSVYFLNNTNKAWTNVSVSSNSTLVSGRGYMVIVADTRTGTKPNFQYSFPGRVIDTRGNPNNDASYTLNVNIVGTSLNAANNLLGNPYQSHLDWSAVRSNSSNIEANYYKFNNGNLVPSTDPIAPGQGFVVKATSSTGTVVISQSAKTTSTSSSTFVKTNEGKKYDLQLRLSSPINPFLHEIDLVFDKKSSVNFDLDKDASFIRSFIDEAPSIRLIDDKENELVLNYFSPEKNEVVFPLSIETPISGNYEINLDGLTTNGEYHSAFLINNNTGKKIDLAKSFSAYFDNSNLHSNYSLMLSKEKIINENLITSEYNNISSYTTSDYIVLKNNYDEIKRVSFKLINLLGQTLYEQSEYINPKDEYKIPIHNLKSDVYVIQINADQKYFSKKIVITK